jgi:hypothetical protein
MHSIAVLGIWTLECLFVIGTVGSAVVILLSFVEDARVLFGKDEEA